MRRHAREGVRFLTQDCVETTAPGDCLLPLGARAHQLCHAKPLCGNDHEQFRLHL